MKLLKKSVIFIVCAFLACGTVSAEEISLDDTADYLLTFSGQSFCGSGGEWAAFGLARGAELPEGYRDGCIARAEEYIKECGGVLSRNKHTEYSRFIIALTALDADPRNFAGYDLTAPLRDVDATMRQGINGAVYALLALDCGGYAGERGAYIEKILSHGISGGGFAMSGDIPDADVTAMALQALAKYTYRADVSAAVSDALNCLSAMQNADGGFSSQGTPDSESCAQVLTALCELGIDINDSRFVKNGKTVLEALLSYKTDCGGFAHTRGGEASPMSSEQAYYALVGYERVSGGKSPLYRIREEERRVMPLFSGGTLISGYIEFIGN